ncbi:MAG: tRNA (adenosine(37)-N6)-threonylcarbamoyltransferase complex dimerization subunit type 1 TsaB [Demequinaceae bacterium]|nr:tRNA (adenosine(37)-N6)-threonylcarbamoyltransferase complex dimerization subunit type 1 TsaB [Demequinaceae bacterium]
MELALDTSASISVAIVDGDRLIASASEYAPRSHAEILAPMIRGVMGEADATGADVTRIIVGTGPAPFTGLRVGLVTAQTLGRSWGIPVAGVCSLDALGAEHGGRVTVVADARRREVYWAHYEDGVRVDGPFVSVPEEVRVAGDVIGRGAALYTEVFGGRPEARHDPDPAWLARLVRRATACGQTDFPTRPLYLRRPDVHGGPRA